MDKTVAQPEPVGEEVVRLGFDIRPYTTGLGLVEKPDGDYVWFTQHHRLLEEAKQGQRVLAMEVEQLKSKLAASQAAGELSVYADEEFHRWLEQLPDEAARLNRSKP